MGYEAKIQRRAIAIVILSIVIANYCCAGEDAISAFKRGVAKLEERKADIFDKADATIKYDIKKTDSVLNPMLGLIRVEVHYSGPTVAVVNEFQLLYTDGKWLVKTCVVKVWGADDGDTPGSAIPLTDPKVQKVQNCFD